MVTDSPSFKENAWDAWEGIAKGKEDRTIGWVSRCQVNVAEGDHSIRVSFHFAECARFAR